MKKLIVSAVVASLMVCYAFSGVSAIGSQELSEVRGGEMRPGQELAQDTCNTAAQGEETNGACNDFTVGVTISLQTPWVIGLRAGVNDQVCFGGCGKICVSTDYKRWCRCQNGSHCDTTLLHTCTGGDEYTSSCACGAEFAPCQSCQYVRTGDC